MLVPNSINKSIENFSYQELLTALIPDKSQQENFLKECQYVTLTRVQPEAVIQYNEGYEKNNPHFSFHGNLHELEKTYNQKHQNLTLDFSNYADVLRPEQLQPLNTGLPEHKKMDFLQTFFSFTLDVDAVFLQLLAKYWQQLKDATILNTFLAAIKNSSLSDSFEFVLECYNIKEPIRYLLLDTRLLWMFGLKYLAENPHLYEQLMQEFSSVYHEILEKQREYGYCALAPAD